VKRLILPTPHFGLPLLLGLVAWLALAPSVAAHSLVGRYESPLPLAVYLAGAALAVGLSFAFVLLRDEPPLTPRAGEIVQAPRWLVLGLRALGLGAWSWIVLQTLVGGSSDAEVATLFLWVYGWVGVAIVSAFVAPIWEWLDPFASLYDLIAAGARRLGLPPGRPSAYPAQLGHWPAVVGFALFVWLELVLGTGPSGIVLIGYTVATLGMMGYYGRDAWRDNAETFTVWFRTLNRLAPLAPAGAPGTDRLRRRPFAMGLLQEGWSSTLVVLVALAIGAILFDGLSQTRPWFELFGVLDRVGSTVALFLFLAGIVLLVLWVASFVGIRAMGAGLVPISVGYLVAHYATYLLFDGQRIVVALSDPLQLGWDLFGSASYEPGTDWIPPALVWGLQVASVVGGHMVGAWAGHTAAGSGRRRRLRQLPLATVMVALTTLTLWSLGQAIVEDVVAG
jgi:hypothetical protein